MRTSSDPCAMILLLAAACTAFGAGGGDNASSRPMDGDHEPAPSPEEQARSAYNTGVRTSRRPTSSPLTRRVRPTRSKQAKARAKAEDSLRRRAEEVHARHRAAIRRCTRPGTTWATPTASSATTTPRSPPTIARCKLKPGYPEAIEYRGHAYLGLNRLSEAKEAYLALFGGNRKLAAQLLAAMQEWVGEHRGNPAGVDGRLARVVRILGERAQRHRQPDRGAHARRRQRRLVERAMRRTRARAWHRCAGAAGHGGRGCGAICAGNCRADFPSPRCRPTIR